jgi:hypothetical protein
MAILEPPRLNCERCFLLRARILLFTFDADPDPAFHSDADRIRIRNQLHKIVRIRIRNTFYVGFLRSALL